MSTAKFLALGVAVVVVASSGSAGAGGDGEALFKKKCSACHSVKAGIHKTGPSLAGVIGRRAGSTSFTKYKGLKTADFIWGEDNIDLWLTDPKKFIHAPASMTVKVKNKDERIAIVEFLKMN